MKTLLLKTILASSAVAIGLTSVSVPAVAQQKDPTQKTADDQKNNKADTTLTAEIRKQILNDKSLSTSAHNVKIVSENGVVTMRGDVNSTTEKNAVLSIARKVAGASNVTDQITIAPPKP
jgi:osmotically-inducible protein OsmY